MVIIVINGQVNSIIVIIIIIDCRVDNEYVNNKNNK